MRKFTKLQKKTLKRFNSIRWDTDDFISHPIDLKFPHSISTFSENIFIQDFFLSKKDNRPFISIFCKTGEDSDKNFLIGFGWEENTFYKKAKSLNTGWDIPTMDINRGMVMSDPVYHLVVE